MNKLKNKMKDLTESKFNFKMNIMGANKDSSNKYEVIHKDKTISLNEMIDKIIDNEEEFFDFKIQHIMNENIYNVNLSKNCINEISLFINEDNNNSQLYNIDLLIQNESAFQPKIFIKYKKSSHKYLTHFNDLNICKITLLDVDLKYLEIYVSQNEQNESQDLNYENHKLLYNKDFNKIEKRKKIEFKINYEKLKTKNLLFCLNYFDINHILTIHENCEKKLIKINKKISQNDLDNLDKEITEKINILKEKIDEEKCDWDKFKTLLLNELNEYDFENPSVVENNYFIMLDYFKKYIIYIICNTIKEIIERFFIYYEQPSPTKLNILKKNVKYILIKYEQFTEYINFIEGKKSKVKNLIIDNNNPSQKEKIEILSVLLTILLSSPIFELNSNIEFMEITKNKRSIYYKSIEFFNKIINKLNKESFYIRGFRQTFSRIKRDINEINRYAKNENTVFIIENRDLNSLKNLMRNYLPTKIVRFINTCSKQNSIYDIYSKNVIINEAIFINREKYDFKQNNNKIYELLNPIIKGEIDLNIESNLFSYNLYTYKAFWRIIHEGLGHKPVSVINKNLEDTPGKFIMNGVFRKISDAGTILESYIVDSRDEFEILLYKNYDAKTLLNEDLYTDTSFLNFWNEFDQIKIIEDKIITKENKENELYLFIIDIFEENKNSSSKVEKYILPRFLWPTHKKLLSII